jgi:hypothetical protein
MAILYYISNLVITSLTLLPALSGLFYHIPLAKKLIASDLITDGNELIKINYKRTIIFSAVYWVFIVLSLYFIGVETWIPSTINAVLCIAIERKKIAGRDESIKKAFLGSNEKYFKDVVAVTTFINNEK